MKIKSGLITQWSGSVGGMTGSHNQGGLYLRARTIPVNTNTAQQQAVRNGLKMMAGRWQSELTDTQREAWKTYSTNVPLVDKLGEVRPVGAIAMYQRSNIPRSQAGLDIVDDGPTTYSLPSFSAVTVTATAGSPGSLSVTFGATDSWTSVDGSALLVYVSREQSPSINSFRGPYRYAGKIEGNSTTPPTSPASIDAPFDLTADNKVFIKITLSTADGRYSAPYRTVATITSA